MKRRGAGGFGGRKDSVANAATPFRHRVIACQILPTPLPFASPAFLSSA
jgi:hypothetical protein